MSPIRFKRPGDPEPLGKAAAQWVLRAEQGLSAAEEEELRAWLAEPAHASAYEDALWGLDSLQRHAASPELMAMRQVALARPPEPSRSSYWGAAIGAVAAVFFWVFLWFVIAPAPIAHSPRNSGWTAASAQAEAGVYRTGVGERSAVVLPDGSIATLDTDSELRVAYSNKERGVHLDKGQALFEVAKGRPIPFQVYANGQRIIAVGTTFNVRIDGDRVQVSMVEGVVKVRPTYIPPKAGAPVQEVTLRAGEVLTTRLDQPNLINSVSTREIATWRGGLLVFQDEKLSDAVAEVNRYTDRPIRLADASIGNYRVTGVFRTNDPGHFATAMSEVFPLEVDRDVHGEPVLKSQR